MNQPAAAASAMQLLLPPAGPPATIPPGDARLVRLGGATMGTSWSLLAAAPPAMTQAMLDQAIQAVLARIIQQMSQWQPASQITAFNTAAAGTFVRIGADFAHVLQAALMLAAATEGAFDPCLGAISEAWGFGVSNVPEITPPATPSAGEWRRLRLIQPAGDAAALLQQPGGVRLDLSAIAKGHAVDAVILALARIGISNALMEIGGELRAIGLRPDGCPWWVDLEVPPASTAPATRIGLAGWACATSGHYIRRCSAAGRSWSHTLAPHAGMPVSDALQAATVLHHSAMLADGLATALLVLAARDGTAATMAFADRHHLPARLVGTDGIRNSAAWEDWAG